MESRQIHSAGGPGWVWLCMMCWRAWRHVLCLLLRMPAITHPECVCCRSTARWTQQRGDCLLPLKQQLRRHAPQACQPQMQLILLLCWGRAFMVLHCTAAVFTPTHMQPSFSRPLLANRAEAFVTATTCECATKNVVGGSASGSTSTFQAGGRQARSEHGGTDLAICRTC